MLLLLLLLLIAVVENALVAGRKRTLIDDLCNAINDDAIIPFFSFFQYTNGTDDWFGFSLATTTFCYVAFLFCSSCACAVLCAVDCCWNGEPLFIACKGTKHSEI